MDFCHLKDAELSERLQTCEGRVVLGEDNVKDDSGDYAVFTEQGASASHMTAAKVLDTDSPLTRHVRRSNRCCFRMYSGQDE